MAFNFYGTYTSGQHEELAKLSFSNEYDIQFRIDYINTLQLKHGKFDFSQPGYAATPGSYCAKLLKAFRILGGVPESIFLMRGSDTPVYLEEGTPLTNAVDDDKSGLATTFSNGRQMRQEIRYDVDKGVKIEKLKSWQRQIIKQRLEHLEFKIKRALDYYDSLENEKNLLTKMISDKNPESSVGYLVNITSVEQSGAGPVAPSSTDKHGLLIGNVMDVTIPKDYDNAAADNMRFIRPINGSTP
jgi:hypothetical protein